MNKTAKALLRFLLKLLIIAAAVWALLTFAVAIRIFHTNEMFPAVRDGDLLVFQRFGEPRFDDVVLYKVNGEEHIGRIVARSGDRIVIDETGLYVNGSAVYGVLPFRTEAREAVSYPLVLGEGEFFILADLREQAQDSRDFGAIPQESIIGREILAVRRRSF